MLLDWCSKEVGEAGRSDESWHDNVYFEATDPQALVEAARAKVRFGRHHKAALKASRSVRDSTKSYRYSVHVIGYGVECSTEDSVHVQTCRIVPPISVQLAGADITM